MLSSTYWFTSANDNVESVYHPTFRKAVDFAIKNNCATVERHIMTKDAVPRLYNGGGGFVEESFIEWTNPNKLD